MPRRREFDEAEVIARATDLFWRCGYGATSVRDLGDELDLSASSLYRTFGDKHSLFLRALDHYRATESTENRDRLAASGPSRQVLRDWMLWMVDVPAGSPRSHGCFAVNTATELGVSDAEVQKRTEAAFETTRKAIEQVLRRGCRAGELPADLDVVAAAGMLFTTLLGLQVRVRAGHDTAAMTGAIDFAIRALGCGENPGGHRNDNAHGFRGGGRPVRGSARDPEHRAPPSR